MAKCNYCSREGFIIPIEAEEIYLGNDNYRIDYYQNSCSFCGCREVSNKPPLYLKREQLDRDELLKALS